MKKHLTTLFLALMLTTIAAAQGGKIRIEGTIDSKKWDGKLVVLSSKDKSIVSDKIKQGKFIIEDSISRPQLLHLDVQDENESFFFGFYGFIFSDSPIIGNNNIILEPGTIHIDFHDEDGRLRCTLSGTPLNDRLQEYGNQFLADTLPLDNPLRHMIDINSGQVKPKDKEEFWATVKPVTYYTAKQRKRNIDRLWDIYHANEHNPLGLYAIRNLLYLEDNNWSRKDFTDSILRTADPEVAETIKYQMEDYKRSILIGDYMLDFEGNAIHKIKGTDSWSASAPATFKQLQAKRMSIIYFWGYDINNNVRDELVQLRSLLDSIGAKDINFIGVYSSEYELHKLPERLNSTGIDFPVFIDTDHQIATLYNSREHHHAFLLVDPDGIILVSTLHSFFNNDTKRNLRAFLQ